MEANLIENNSSDLSLHVNKGERRSFADATKLCKASLCVRRDGGRRWGRESFGENTESWYQKPEEEADEGKKN